MPTLSPTTPIATRGRQAALILGAAALITLGAKIQVPFWPVPMTLQTLAVLLVAAALGPRLGLAAMGSYLAAGLAGLPVFAGAHAGPAYLAGPTGGYLIGMALAAGVTGWLAQGRRWAGQALAMLAGTAAVYAVGLAWLAAFVPADKLIAAGLAPFLPGDLVKVALACMVLAGFRRLRA